MFSLPVKKACFVSILRIAMPPELATPGAMVEVIVSWLVHIRKKPGDTSGHRRVRIPKNVK